VLGLYDFQRHDLFVDVHADGARLCLFTAATTGPIFYPQMIYERAESHCGMILTEEDRRTWRETSQNATLSTTNLTWTEPGANPGLRVRRSAISLNHGTVSMACILIFMKIGRLVQ
jgi:hypothetical protein